MENIRDGFQSNFCTICLDPFIQRRSCGNMSLKEPAIMRNANLEEYGYTFPVPFSLAEPLALRYAMHSSTSASYLLRRSGQLASTIFHGQCCAFISIAPERTFVLECHRTKAWYNRFASLCTIKASSYDAFSTLH